MIFKNNKTSKVDSLLIRTLQWSSARGSAGFEVSELKSTVTKNEEEWVWINRMMMGQIKGDPPLIFHLDNPGSDGSYRYFITGSGESVLIDYIELKEARENASSAMNWAILSFCLAVAMGLGQIMVEIFH